MNKNNFVTMRLSSLDAEILEKFRNHLETMLGEDVSKSQAIRAAIKRAWIDVQADKEAC